MLVSSDHAPVFRIALSIRLSFNSSARNVRDLAMISVVEAVG